MVAVVKDLDVRKLALVPVALPAARRLVEPEEILQARRLHAREYVGAGYLGQEAIAADGTACAEADPWVSHSRYFGAFDAMGRVRATLRLIGNDAPCPLPTLQLSGIDPASRGWLADLPLGRLGEISALARDREAGTAFTRAVFHAIWVDTMASQVTDWVLNVDMLVLRTLRAMGHALFRVIGSPSPAPVRPVLPVWARPSDFVPSTFTNGLAGHPVVLP